MRIFLFILFLLVQTAFHIMAEAVGRFTPLNDNERFAFSTRTISDAQRRAWQRITMFAVRNNNITNVSELFIWEPVRFETIQFTSDLKKVFFVESNTDRWGAGATLTNNLYMANGLTGEIRRLLTDISFSSYFRVSKDGRFILFRSRHFYIREFVNLYLFDVEIEAIVGKFEWRPDNPVDWVTIESWELFRFDNAFRIYGTDSGRSIWAAAELDLTTMELQTIWNKIGILGWQDLPLVFDAGWREDVPIQLHDPSVRLQR